MNGLSFMSIHMEDARVLPFCGLPPSTGSPEKPKKERILMYFAAGYLLGPIVLIIVVAVMIGEEVGPYIAVIDAMSPWDWAWGLIVTLPWTIFFFGIGAMLQQSSRFSQEEGIFLPSVLMAAGCYLTLYSAKEVDGGFMTLGYYLFVTGALVFCGVVIYLALASRKNP
jgi:hypothetical protein